MPFRDAKDFEVRLTNPPDFGLEDLCGYSKRKIRGQLPAYEDVIFNKLNPDKEARDLVEKEWGLGWFVLSSLERGIDLRRTTWPPEKIKKKALEIVEMTWNDFCHFHQKFDKIEVGIFSFADVSTRKVIESEKLPPKSAEAIHDFQTESSDFKGITDRNSLIICLYEHFHSKYPSWSKKEREQKTKCLIIIPELLFTAPGQKPDLPKLARMLDVSSGTIDPLIRNHAIPMMKDSWTEWSSS